MKSAEAHIGDGKIHLEKLRYHGLPIGKWMEHLFTLFGDRESLAGLGESRKELSSRGLLILDAHLTPLDIIASGVSLSQHLPFSTVVLPVSAYDESSNPQSRWFFSRLGTILGVEAYPVYRQKDQEYVDRREAYQAAVDENLVSESNVRFFRRSLRAVKTPHEAVLITPYNGENRFGAELTPSVRKLMQAGMPGLCTLSIPDGSLCTEDGIDLSYQTFVSDHVLRFTRRTENTEILDAIIRQHERLAQRADAAGFLVALRSYS